MSFLELLSCLRVGNKADSLHIYNVKLFPKYMSIVSIAICLLSSIRKYVIGNIV